MKHETIKRILRECASYKKNNFTQYSLERASTRIAIQDSLCKECNKPFNIHKGIGWKGVFAVVEEIEHGWLRGDDEVNFYHKNCFIKKLA